MSRRLHGLVFRDWLRGRCLLCHEIMLKTNCIFPAIGLNLLGMRRMQWIVITTAVLVLAGIGCNKPASKQTPPATSTQSAANQPPANPPPAQGTAAYPPLPSSTAPATSSAAPPPAPSTAPPPASVAAQPAPPPEPISVTIPAGEHATVSTIDPIDSATNTAGQVFRATLAAPLVSHGRVVIPAGVPVSIELVASKSAGRIKGRAELEVTLARIDYHGRSYPVVSSVYEEQGKARGKQTAVRTGIGAAAGAIIGGIAGGGKGAAIGSAAGGGAGFGVNVFTHGQQVKIPSETLLTFRLRRPLTVQL